MNVPISTTVAWVLGLVGFLGVVLLVLQVTATAINLLSRKPPLNEELERRDQSHRERMNAMQVQVLQLRQDMDQRFEGLQIERQRNLEMLHEKMNAVIKTVEYMRGEIRHILHPKTSE